MVAADGASPVPGRREGARVRSAMEALAVLPGPDGASVVVPLKAA